MTPPPPLDTLLLTCSSSPLVLNAGQSVTVTYSSSGAASLMMPLATGPVTLDPSPGTHTFTFTPTESSPFPIKAFDPAGGSVTRPMSVIVQKTRAAIDPAAAATRASVKDGQWDDPATWGGTAPTETDVVSIAHSVKVVGRNNLAGHIIGQAGCKLWFDYAAGGVLHAGSFDMLAGSVLEMGVPSNPITSGRKALIVLLNRPTHASDTAKFWPALRVRGTFSACGQPATRYVRLASDVVAGATFLDVTSPVVGWAGGQKIWLPDSRQNRDATVFFGEQAIIRYVRADGLRVYLMDPLVWAHPSCFNPDGTLFTRPHVVNLSGVNVGIITEDPTTTATRAHVSIESPASVDLRNLVIHGTGRTLNTTLNAANPDDRLPFRLQGLSSFNVENCVSLEPFPIVTATTTSVRWGMTASNCTGGTFRNCVSFNWAGEGFACRNSTNVLFDGCFATKILGNGDRGDANPLGIEGSGFWSNRAANRWRNCVAADCSMYGWILFCNGATVEGITEFDGCELYSTNFLFTIWLLGTSFTTWQVAQPESVISNLTTWHPRRACFYPYPINRLTMDGWKARGSRTLMNDQNLGATCWYPQDYLQNEVIIRNSDIRGFRVGFNAPGKAGDVRQTGTTWRPYTIQDTHLQCKYDVVVSPEWANTGGGVNLPPRDIFLTRVVHGPITSDMGSLPYEVFFDWRLGDPNANPIQGSRVWVTDRGGVSGENFRAYSVEQSASFITPVSGAGVVGAPVAGQTNQQNHDQYGVSVYGEITPVGAVVASWTNGRAV